MKRQFHASRLFDGRRWRADVLLEVGPDGLISSLEDGVAGDQAERLAGTVIPGMPNLHSHAFQRAMAGRAEYQTDPGDSFWTWRELMYRVAGRLGPEEQEAVATQLYVEMLQAGYTQVCEFHYLHHDPGGKPYADPAEMSLRLLAAAERAGIGITLLPVLYQQGGFDGRELSAGQRRFGNDTDQYLELLERLASMTTAVERGLGVCFHSLRAVGEEALTAVLAAREDRATPVHIHIAEQEAEVADCLAHRGARPVRWLLDHCPVDARWCLVHATHLDRDETRDLARSGAVAGLCPSTEANLGDGIFPLPDYRQGGGVWGIGSDSQSSVSPVEELRWLEYVQRLLAKRRNRTADASAAHCGRNLWAEAVAGGARAAGAPLGELGPEHRGDWLVLDDETAQLWGLEGDALLDALIFSGNRDVLKEVYVAGRCRLRDGRHPDQEPILERYRRALDQLF